MDNTNILSADVKHLDISNKSCDVKTGTSIEVESGFMEVDGGECGLINAALFSTIVGGTAGSVAAGIVVVGGTRSLDIDDQTLETHCRRRC